MAHVKGKSRLLVIGVHLDSEAYPNTRYRLRDLRASPFFDLSEINVPMWSEATQHRNGLSRLGRNAGRMLFAHAAVICRLLFSKKPEQIYITYPAVFLLFLLSFLPVNLRSGRVVADAFISLYDTIVNDRRLLKRDCLPARLLRKIEGRAYHFADILIVDTPQNARFLAEFFDLPASKLEVVPLSTDEENFQTVPYIVRAGVCRVLFVGTMVPLHGIATILEAASLLSARKDIRFMLLGDGQDGALVESWLNAQSTTIVWERQWQSSEKIARYISESDICLGIFGAGDKTQRVCPFKIYAYAGIGRAIITGDTRWSKQVKGDLRWDPFAVVPVNDAKALATMIAELADKPELRSIFAANSRKFYLNSLSNVAALERLSQCLGEFSTGAYASDGSPAEQNATNP